MKRSSPTPTLTHNEIRELCPSGWSSRLLVIPRSLLRPDRRDILRVLEGRPFVGGIVCAKRKDVELVSLVTSESRTLDQENMESSYDWASEEITCASEVNLDILFFDVGPEIFLGLGLDPCIRACLNSESKSKLIIITEDDVIEKLGEHYGTGAMLECLEHLSELDEVLEPLDSALSQHKKSKRHHYQRKHRRVKGNVGKSSYFYHVFLRFPILFGIGFFLVLELIAYVFVRVVVVLWEKTKRKHRQARASIQNATTYASWRRAALKLDILEGLPAGGHTVTRPEIENRIEKIEMLCAKLRKLEDDSSVPSPGTPSMEHFGDLNALHALEQTLRTACSVSCTFISLQTFKLAFY